MNPLIEKMTVQIQQLKQEVAATERAPRTIAERFEIAAAELRAAEELYRTRGLNPCAAHPGGTQHCRGSPS